MPEQTPDDATAQIIDAHTFFTTKRSARASRLADGLARRAQVPLASHAISPPMADRPDSLAILRSQESSREPALIPLRYARMAESPFAFLRGAAAVMASDLSWVPRSDLNVQLCGDAHLANFGMFASTERVLMFDMNDFDETLPGSFDWDVKRLAVSMAVAAQSNGLKDKDARKAARACVASYRVTMAKLSDMRTLDVWNARLDVDTLLARLTKSSLRKATVKASDKSRRSTTDSALLKLTEVIDGKRIVSKSLAGSARRMQSLMQVQALDHGSQIDYRIEIEPASWIPSSLGINFLQHELAEQFNALGREMLRRK